MSDERNIERTNTENSFRSIGFDLMTKYYEVMHGGR
jgi:hypothetical protein